MKEQGVCITFRKLILLIKNEWSDNYHKTALWKCELHTVTSQNRFGDRDRKASSIVPELSDIILSARLISPV